MPDTHLVDMLERRERVGVPLLQTGLLLLVVSSQVAPCLLEFSYEPLVFVQLQSAEVLLLQLRPNCNHLLSFLFCLFYLNATSSTAFFRSCLIILSSCRSPFCWKYLLRCSNAMISLLLPCSERQRCSSRARVYFNKRYCFSLNSIILCNSLLLNCSKYLSHTPSKCRASLSSLTLIDFL